MRRALALLTIPLLANCATPIALDPVAIANPVIDADFADPAVMKARDGFYYVYATQSGDGSAMRNIQVARSSDLADWEGLPDALPVKPAWASRTQDFWAPHAHEAEGRYFLYYSAKPDAALDDPERGLCLAIATASRPEGPFTDMGHPLQCGPSFVNIDPMAFDDPATGKRLLYWGSGFGAIKVRELAPDRLSFAPGSQEIELIQPVRTDDPGEYQRLVEGAWITLRDGWYYLFYSGDNCCGPNAHYAAMVARSRGATGPFETLAEATGAPNSAILEADDRWVAPGHNSVVEDAAGQTWIAYHAVDRRRPRTRPSEEVNTRRVMVIAPLVWKDGWPVAASSPPSE